MLISSTSSNSLIQTLNNLFIQSTDNNLQHDIESIIHSNNMNQDNISIWNSDLTTLCSDLVRIFLNSGLKLPASVVNAIVEESTIKSLLLKNKQYGNNKINTLDTCFQNIIHALSCLLTRGCESGAVSINLDLLLPVLTTILSLNIRADINNAKVCSSINFYLLSHIYIIYI